MTGLEGVIPALQVFGEVLKTIKDPEMRKKVLDAQQECQMLLAKLIASDTENRELKEQLRFKANLKFSSEENIYWSDDPSDPGPYCATCWDTKKMPVHLQHRASDFLCVPCKRTYVAKSKTGGGSAVGGGGGRDEGIDWINQRF